MSENGYEIARKWLDTKMSEKWPSSEKAENGNENIRKFFQRDLVFM